MPRVQDLACEDMQGDFPYKAAGNQDVQNGFCSTDGIPEQCPAPQNGSAPGHPHRRTLSRLLEWIRSHPMFTLVLILLLLLLVVALVMALVVALAVHSARTRGEMPVTPGTPQLPDCSWEWIGHHGVCYYLSRDEGTWEQGQDRCSELGASLAVLSDEEMEFLFHFTQHRDYWIGLLRRGERLRWGDSSTYNSSFPVLGNAECVSLSHQNLRSGNCSNQLQYLCSKAQTHLAQK